jgi:hypothetical protein
MSKKLYKVQRTSGLPFLASDIDKLQQDIASNFDKIVKKVGWDGHSAPEKHVFERSDRLLKRTENIIRQRYPVEGLVELPATEEEVKNFVKTHGTLILTLTPDGEEVRLYIMDSQV